MTTIVGLKDKYPFALSVGAKRRSRRVVATLRLRLLRKLRSARTVGKGSRSSLLRRANPKLLQPPVQRRAAESQHLGGFLDVAGTALERVADHVLLGGIECLVCRRTARGLERNAE